MSGGHGAHVPRAWEVWTIPKLLDGLRAVSWDRGRAAFGTGFHSDLFANFGWRVKTIWNGQSRTHQKTHRNFLSINVGAILKIKLSDVLVAENQALNE